MPIYEYQCPQCDAVFEEWVTVSDASNTAPCPHCGADATHIISNTAFVLKGGGWYVTDYGNRKNDTSEGKSSVAPVASGSGEAAATPAPASTEGAAPAATQAPAASPSSGTASSAAEA